MSEVADFKEIARFDVDGVNVKIVECPICEIAPTGGFAVETSYFDLNGEQYRFDTQFFDKSKDLEYMKKEVTRHLRVAIKRVTEGVKNA